ncbi:tetratricopeptide repeat protein [Actinokineospora diospyrosa]|uniref:Tetratricopeptide repeat-containing protein n=1 Tax=Actinokineospora diospyrosa TaxID=103728 RepID=A0ABT1ID98_9PSEU|nr:tetratricopeptide repeat protein [Actinokineospora diospyrosa]MCP2270584.1 Tetratricopeptide repeat-containing protein [Actinokineospora diospyrosa]
MRGGRGAWRWAAVVLLAAAGAATAPLKPLGVEQWAWLAITAAVAAAVAAVPAKLLTAQLERTDKRRDDRRQELASATLRAGTSKVRDVTDPTVLGVHRALTPHGAAPTDPVPVYVPRDRHAAVAEAMKPGSFVLLVGDSGAGKSRLAYEVMREQLAEYTLFAPEPRGLSTAIDEAADTRQAVLWLDDLERFLIGEGLTPTSVDRVLANGVVVATLRLQELDRLEEDADNDHEGIRRVLAIATRVRIDRVFTEPELGQARDRDRDPRIAEALLHADVHGLAEYLAAGPQLLERWHNGRTRGTHPRGAALVSAAVELRRAGYHGPLPRALLEKTHEVAPSDRPEDLEAAWTWATQPWHDSVALLEPMRNDAVAVFDYLVDHTQRTTSPDNPPSAELIVAALDHASSSDNESMGLTAYRGGRYELAYTAYSRAVAMHTDDRSPEMLSLRSALATLAEEMGRLDEAEAGHRVVVALATEVLGAEHPDTLAARRCLGLTWYELGRLAEAEAELSAVAHIARRVHGPDDIATVEVRGDLASIAHDQGKLPEAEAELRALLDICTRVHGPEHVDTLACRNMLALVVCDAGRVAAAEAMHREVLRLRTKTLGAEHPHALTSRNNLAITLARLGRHTEAEVEHRAELEICARVLGPEHPHTLASRNNLATALGEQGRFPEAEAEHRAVLEICTRVLGAEHPHTLICRANHADVLVKLGSLAEAEAEHRAILDLRIKVFGHEHPDTEQSRAKIASIRGIR